MVVSYDKNNSKTLFYVYIIAHSRLWFDKCTKKHQYIIEYFTINASVTFLTHSIIPSTWVSATARLSTLLCRYSRSSRLSTKKFSIDINPFLLVYITIWHIGPDAKISEVLDCNFAKIFSNLSETVYSEHVNTLHLVALIHFVPFPAAFTWMLIKIQFSSFIQRNINIFPDQ